MRIIRWSALAVASLAFAGCTVGPNYHQPATRVPSGWSETLAGGETNGPVSPIAWWKTFHDAELNGLIERAVSSNLDLRIAQARVRQERAQYSIASADLLPSIEGSGSYARESASRHQPVLGSLPIPANVPFENDVFQTGFDASWELDVFGGKRREVEAARARLGASEFSRRSTLLTLLGDVARNYVSVRACQQRLGIARENIDAQTKALAITQDRFQHGLTSDLDVEQSSALLANTKAEVPALESLLHAAIHRLGVLLGQPPGALMAELSKADVIPSIPPEVPTGLPSDLLLRRPDIQHAERQLAAATANIGIAQADLFPKFYLTGAAGLESVSAGDWFSGGSSFWSVGPTIKWKLFEGGRVRANIKLQTERQREALAAYEQTVLSAFEDVENALVFYAKEQVRRRSLQTAAESSTKSLAVATDLYRNGLTDFLHVLEAERSLYLAQDALARSDQAISVNLISLYKALGGGWETLDPQALTANTSPL